MLYSKPPLPISEQIELLRTRKLSIETDADLSTIEKQLNRISYQRLKSYFVSFYLPQTQTSFKKEFKPATSFAKIIQLYDFDFAMRLLIFDYTSQIEIALRTQLVNVYSLRYGATWFLNKENFDVKTINYTTGYDSHDDLISFIKTDCHKDCDHPFVKQYFDHYPIPPNAQLPPSWITMESISFGKLSKIYKQLKSSEEKRSIARFFGTIPSYLESWLAALSYVRNICAHHGLLWRRNLVKQPMLPTKKDRKLIESNTPVDVRKLFVTLCCLQAMVKSSSIHNTLKLRLLTLFNQYPDIDIQRMGFYTNWDKEKIWN
ncbi:MAG: Abi family protein [Bacteroidia bacterium]